MQRELEWVATDRKETSNKFLEVKKADERMVTGNRGLVAWPVSGLGELP